MAGADNELEMPTVLDYVPRQMLFHAPDLTNIIAG